ncbi:MAG: helix-turn-helix domain-containing protein [Caldilineaceae bacterium]
MTTDLMNVSEFARYVGYSRQTIYTDIKEGILSPTTRRGISYLFTYAEADAYIQLKQKKGWKPLVISDNTHNGGSGKTFSMTNLMVFLAEEGYKVLGMDPTTTLSLLTTIPP